MDRPRVAGVATFLVVLLVAGTVTPVAGQGAPAEPDQPPIQSASTADPVDASAVDGSIDLTHEFSLTPDRPGEVRVETTWEVPDNAVSLSTTLPESVTVVGTSGFSQASGRTYEWDNTTSTATITYTVQVNETIEMTGPEAGPGQYLFADAGEWALFRRPQLRAEWSWRGAPALALERSYTTAGPGAAGSEMVYLGEQRTYRRTAHGQSFNLVVPARAQLAEQPSAVLDSLATASDQLRVGDRDEEVYVFVAPTRGVSWGVSGLQYGDTDMWVRDVERLDTAGNTWLHEYVHSRQDFETTTATKWVTEASATYYAALLSLEQDRISLSAFRDHLQIGTRLPQAASILAEPSSWRNSANYLKGMVVAGELDRLIREASNKRRSLQSVISAMNTADLAVGQQTFVGLVGGVSNTTVGRLANRYTTTRDVPDVWSASAHREAFGTTPARLSLQFTGTKSVSGPYRNTTIDGTRIYVNETLTVGVAMKNTGDVSMETSGILSVDGQRVTTFEATLGPGETTTREVSHLFTEAGEHTLTFGDDTMTVLVSNPARAGVTASSVNRTTLAKPGAVEMTATVSNNQSIPAEKTVTFRKNGDKFAKRTVRLGAGGERTISVVATLDKPGEYVLRAGRDDPISVTVGDSQTGSDASATDERAGTDGDGGKQGDDERGDGQQETKASGDGGPGFGVGAALLALLVVVIAGRRAG